jgi:hypothetical protein
MSDRPEDLDEQFEVVAGRKAPLTLVPDWITLYPGTDKSPMYRGKILSPQAKAVYNVLAMHVNVDRGDGTCWPSRKTIASILGFSREQSVDPYLDQLDEADAIDRQPITRPNGALGVRYIVHQTPPPGYDGEQSISEHYKRRREEQAEQQTRPPGRPRKTAAPAAAPATPEPAAEETPEQPPAAKKAPAKKAPAKKAAAGKAPAKKGTAPAKKAPAKKAAEKAPAKQKTPEELEIEELAQVAADAWWEEAKKMVANNDMGPLIGSTSGPYLNLRKLLKESFEAGYDKGEIWRALHHLRTWSPAKWQLDKALQRERGIRGRPNVNGPTPMFRNDQWQQGTPEQGEPTTSEARPERPRFGVDVQAV